MGIYSEEIKVLKSCSNRIEREDKLKQRIKELQEQQFTEKELRLMECLVRVYIMIHKITDDEATSKTLLKKIERILNER